MLLGRRNPPRLMERLRVGLWPRRSWFRSVKYWCLRLSRLKGTPHTIALGCACGVLVSFTPFFGIQFLLAGLLAFAIRGNVLAAALGTFFGNPLTLPLIWVSSYQLGSMILGSGGTLDMALLQQGLGGLIAAVHQVSIDAIVLAFEMIWPVLKPMSIGSLPLGIVMAILGYYPVKRAITAFQSPRQFAGRGNTGIPLNA